MANRPIEEIQKERDALNPVESRKYFFDINKDGIIAPKSRNEMGASDLAIVTNEEAVIESVFNIVLTEPGEKVMDPLFGCALDQFLFSPIDDVTSRDIVNTISASLELYETRLLDFDVIVTAMPDDNTYDIEIVVEINTSEEPIIISTSLEKLR